MCTGAEALLAASLVSTAGGAVMGNQQQKRATKKYNNQVSAQNRLLSEQFADRQKQVGAAKEDQAKVFNEIASKQDAEFERQKQLAAEKEQVFKEALQKPSLIAAQSPAFDESVANRDKMFKDTDGFSMPDYGGNAAASTENRVLRDAADKSLEKQSAKSNKVAGALSKISALRDANQGQAELFRDLGTGIKDVANKAVESSRLLNFSLRPQQYRMGALDASMRDRASAPYYRGEEPVFRYPNSTASDILMGAGKLGSTAAFMGADPSKIFV
jgi:hypothetical protein